MWRDEDEKFDLLKENGPLPYKSIRRTADMDTRPYGELTLTSEGFKNPRVLNRSGLAKKDLRELAQDIARRGLLYPLLITRDGLILGGQRRYLAIGIIMAADPADAAWQRKRQFERDGIPVRVLDCDGLEAATTALADNLHRAALSSFEVAERLAALSDADGGPTGAELAERIGKSRTYVSRMLKAWRGAGPQLKRAWSAGTVTYQRVKEVADLPTGEQQAALKGAGRDSDRYGKPGPKGAHGRPGVEALKGAHERLQEVIDSDDEEAVFEYALGARDALAYALGEPAANRLVHFCKGTAT
ncbi:MAG: hypothetical protein KJO40_13655 [Deltaproteobacteria bacterium]|nr:hypothetical protein [Deltaproteobacteria bacterium]